MNNEAFLEHVMLLVKEHGHAIQSLADNTGTWQPYSYTTGLAERFGGEIAIIGVEQTAAIAALNDVAIRLAGGIPLQVGPVPGIPPTGFDGFLVPLPTHRGFEMADRVAGRMGVGTFQMWQLLWPDAHGIRLNWPIIRTRKGAMYAICPDPWHQRNLTPEPNGEPMWPQRTEVLDAEHELRRTARVSRHRANQGRDRR